MPVQTPICDFGKKALPFELKSTENKVISLDDISGENGTLIMFICNHCPYVKSIISRIIRDTEELKQFGINSVGIMSNDPNEYEEDSFDNMKKLSLDHNFPFPYLIDETQEIARAYGAVCTPDFFGYNDKLGLQYRGRLDESRKESVDGAKRELFEAMKQISITGKGPDNQIPSMGCSIKWFE